MSVYLYIEGGGDSRAQQSDLREAFRKLLQSCGFTRPKQPLIKLCGSRRDAFQDFKNALPVHGNSAILLVDSEGAVTAATAWQHVCDRDRWSRPPGMRDDQVHLMIELMESWFLSCPDKLQAYFGAGFRAARLPGNAATIESIAKLSVERGLKAATRQSTRGQYDKGRHSAELLANLDTLRLQSAAPHFASLIEAIRNRI